jgi:hypothetical protein
MFHRPSLEVNAKKPFGTLVFGCETGQMMAEASASAAGL